MNYRRTMRSLAHAALSLITLLAAPSTLLAKGEQGKPPPDLVNVKYGPAELNVFDLWKAKSDKPTPLVVYIHGGGFKGGRKETAPPQEVIGCLNAGISIATVDYRLSPDVAFPAHYMDCARALQFLRSKAKEYNIDPTRVALSGSSAGAGTSLWIAFHDDMADPKSDDPVLHESTRVTCVAVTQAQSTYDPRIIKQLAGEAAAHHPALPDFYGLKVEELDTPKAYDLYEKASPVTHLKTGAPPVYAYYGGTKAPVAPDAKPGEGIHHVNFGYYLKERMDKLGIECTIHCREDHSDPFKETIDFLVKHLQPAK